MAKHFLERLRNELDLLYNNGTDKFRLVLLEEVVTRYNFTARANTAELTTSEPHNLVVGVRVKLTNSGGALPTGLNTTDTYYVVAAYSPYLSLSETKGGEAIVVSNAGSGTHTIIEQPISEIDGDMAVLIRHEIDYFGATPRPEYNPEPARIDIANSAAFLPSKTVTFEPTEASITFRYSLLVRNGQPTRSNVAGTADNFQDHGTTQTIPRNASKGIEIFIRRKDT